ncbi:MAG: acetyl-CoA C-acyltransferase, partial [Myxococcales bacterium]|nr:acetyl-CoA C-acyltransferase [Myxococcales bacterium]
VPAYTLNMICGSGMKTIMDGAAHIKAGDADIVVAAGMESMSNIPYLMPAKTRFGSKMGNMTMVDAMVNDGLTDVFNNYHMGMTAENIVEQFGLTREQQDTFAVGSQHKAIAAIAAGRFVDEIVPVEVKVRRQTQSFATDEYPKDNASVAGLAKLRPAFKADGSVTAANASGINDGAAAIILASEAAVEKYGLEPMAELIAYGQGGVDPQVMGLGPVPAIEQALKRADMSLEQMELLELNEAFAAQALGVMTNLTQAHNVDMDWFADKTNVNGGAIALGHPLGASGGRITVTLLHEMQKRGVDYGLASLCIGGGMGTALIVKNLQK